MNGAVRHLELDRLLDSPDTKIVVCCGSGDYIHERSLLYDLGAWGRLWGRGLWGWLLGWWREFCGRGLLCGRLLRLLLLLLCLLASCGGLGHPHSDNLKHGLKGFCNGRCNFTDNFLPSVLSTAAGSFSA